MHRWHAPSVALTGTRPVRLCCAMRADGMRLGYPCEARGLTRRDPVELTNKVKKVGDATYFFCVISFLNNCYSLWF